MQMFDIETWTDGGVRVVRVTGEFDFEACPPFHEAVRGPEPEPEPEPELLVIDLTRAEFLDSHALGALIGLHTRAQESGSRLAIIRPTGPANRIFSITGADGHLPLYDESVPVLAEMNYG